jgi:hypothetical protein
MGKRKVPLDNLGIANWEKMSKEFENSPLPSMGIKLPREGSQAAETLLFLWQNKGQIVLKNEAERAICSRLNIQARDIQSLRHLSKQKGFNILQGGSIFQGEKLPRGTYVFLGFEQPNKFWSLSRRHENLDWKSIKQKYNNACATCGAVEGRLHRFTDSVVVLEKGHKDPTKPMDEKNIIPQCKDCNKVAKNHIIFDEFGRVKSLTVEGIMARCSKAQLKELKKRLTKETN